ncbi:unnamed protein product [Cladocopium goreaui]|uniref:Transmembrane emp24 domain-containing protein 10 (S31III125) (Transmembrane protein Tmp21) (p24 family protein delta-1) (p24delta1) n=1 Tax=Cladocopium goreaui TaxID=2562237 RepID=A0A9P1CFE6_9DINO|nr:unnamed protein product [Cladocopium goreaui]
MGSTLVAFSAGVLWANALLLLRSSRRSRSSEPDAGAVAAVLGACGAARRWEQCLELLEEMCDRRVEMNLACYTEVLGWTVQLALLVQVASIKVSIQLPAREKKCFGEQAAKLELLVVELSASEGSKVGVTVLSPHATIFSEHDRQQVKTAFTTQDAGPHWICIQNDEATDAEVLLTVLLGPEAKDYSQIAKKEHLEESRVILRRVADRLGHYHSNLLYIRAREERMRRTNDSTATRVSWLSFRSTENCASAKHVILGILTNTRIVQIHI